MRWIACIFILGASGCSSQLSVLTEHVYYVDTADFSVDVEPVLIETVAIPLDANEVVVNEIDSEAVMVEDAIAREEEFDDLMMPKLIGIPLRVESLVGQVNGRPVYANTVLAPIADQIAAEAHRHTRVELESAIRSALYYETETMGTIVRGGRMYELVITDLLLSEAVGSLSKEQSVGLISIVAKMRDDLASSQGGSHTQLRTALETQVGVSVDEFLQLQRDQILIDALYRQRIWPKVNVTWRDIQREFEQVTLTSTEDVSISDERVQAILSGLHGGISLGSIEAAKGLVTIGMIRVKQEDERVVEITEAFANGIAFSEVATSVGIENGGIWETFEFGNGLEDIEVASKIKEQLVGLQEGEVRDPFQLGSSVIWLTIIEIQNPVSLYNREIQIAMNNALRWVQFNREKDRYVESLWGEGSLEEVKKMADSVTAIAIQRYQH